MSILFIIIHVSVSIALIMIVLLQTGKGADMGAAFGGGSSQTLFGSTGGATVLSKLTTGAAVVFMTNAKPAVDSTTAPAADDKPAAEAPAKSE